MEESYQTWLWGKTAERCVKNLKKNGFDAHFVENVTEARALVLEMMSSYKTFGFGGSNTTRALGVKEQLEAMGKTVYDHWQKGLSKEGDLSVVLVNQALGF